MVTRSELDKNPYRGLKALYHPSYGPLTSPILLPASWHIRLPVDDLKGTVFKGSFLRLKEEVFSKIPRTFPDSDRLTRFALIHFSKKKHNTFSDLSQKA